MGSKKRTNVMPEIIESNVEEMKDYRMKQLCIPEYQLLKQNLEALLRYGDSVLNKETVDLILTTVNVGRKEKINRH